MQKIKSAGIACSLMAVAMTAGAADVTVPGTADLWLAGQPAGTTASIEDSAPGQSPTFAGFVTPGTTITWTASGSVANGAGQVFEGPNGDQANDNGYGLFPHYTGAENGISDIQNMAVDSLIGVFIGPGVPSGATPGALDFGPSGLGIAYGTLSPELDQVFYMGDGSANKVVVPAGATRLYLGPMDGFGWDNNEGSFDVKLRNVVTATPDGGSTLALLGGAFGLVGLVRRKLS